jgi:hypothetical protein
MIKSATFRDMDQLNEFVSKNSVKVVSVSNVKERIYTDLPMLRGGDFSYVADVIKLYYEEEEKQVV